MQTTEEARNVTYCEVANDPGRYDRTLLRMTAFVTYGFEDFGILDPTCPEFRHKFSIWVMYGGNAHTGTVYCCPGEGGSERRPGTLNIEGIEVPLVEDAVFRKFNELLRKESDTTVRVTVVGRFFSGSKQAIDGTTWWRGFGHLGCCSLLAIHRIESFEPHSRKDLDYTAEAGFYEDEGCSIQSVRYLRGSDSRKALEEQAFADAGGRIWAFDDPARVANESVRPFYEAETPKLKRVKRTPYRQVFRWREGKRTVVVVVTRPYWLSFYSKSGSVAWVATSIKEARCD